MNEEPIKARVIRALDYHLSYAWTASALCMGIAAALLIDRDRITVGPFDGRLPLSIQGPLNVDELFALEQVKIELEWRRPLGEAVVVLAVT